MLVPGDFAMGAQVMLEDVSTRLKDEAERMVPAERRWRGAKYIGLALLTCYGYLLWLTDGAFYFRGIMTWEVTVAWLVNLATMAASIPLVVALTGRGRHLIVDERFVVGMPVATCALTLGLCYTPEGAGATVFFYVCAGILGVFEVVMWSLWAECTACARSRYSLGHVGVTFGVTFVCAYALVAVLPKELIPLFVSALPLLSGVFLHRTRRCSGTEFPALLPRALAAAVKPNMRIVSGVVFAASVAAAFLCGIIPSYGMLFPMGLAAGVLSGGVILLVLAAVYGLSRKRLGIFQLAPWVIIGCIAAYALYLYGPETLLPASLLTLGCPMVFQVLLVVYFGKLAAKGYFPPTVTFSVSMLCTYAGFALGDGLSLVYEALPASAAAPLVHGTCLACMLLLSIVLVPLVRQEFLLTKLMSDPVPKEKVELICEEIATEFKLSPRESEILKMLAQGATTNRIAEKYVISPNTVNTHIKHIYDKTSIHNRADLIDYVNMRNSEDCETSGR